MSPRADPKRSGQATLPERQPEPLLRVIKCRAGMHQTGRIDRGAKSQANGRHQDRRKPDPVGVAEASRTRSKHHDVSAAIRLRPGSYRDAHAKFHHPIGWDAEEFRRRHGIARHHQEQP